MLFHTKNTLVIAVAVIAMYIAVGIPSTTSASFTAHLGLPSFHTCLSSCNSLSHADSICSTPTCVCASVTASDFYTCRKCAAQFALIHAKIKHAVQLVTNYGQCLHASTAEERKGEGVRHVDDVWWKTHQGDWWTQTDIEQHATRSSLSNVDDEERETRLVSSRVESTSPRYHHHHRRRRHPSFSSAR